MWHKTRITELLKIQYPILQGPMGGGLSSVKLLATVSNAGGLGGYGAYTLEPEQLRQLIRDAKAATGKPFNINLWVSDVDENAATYDAAAFARTQQLFKPYFDELGIPLPEQRPHTESRFAKQVEVLLSEGVPVFSFVFGIPDQEMLDAFRKQGTKLVGAATTIDEALALEAAGVDAIVASGFEAGGHRPSFLAAPQDSLVGTFALVQLLAHKIKVPIIAAGGIADSKGVAASLILGADAAQLGTAFLATEESGTNDAHRNVLFSDAAKYSALTKVFTGRLGRGVKSRLSAEVPNDAADIAPFPLQTQFIAPLRAAAVAQNKPEFITFWGGQSAPVLKYRKAAELMEELITGTGKLLA
jgi:nitronate monooxygenase